MTTHTQPELDITSIVPPAERVNRDTPELVKTTTFTFRGVT